MCVPSSAASHCQLFWFRVNQQMTRALALARVQACLMEKLVSQWRSLWSATGGTTDPLAPFGLVTLPDTGSEGGADIGSMRHAQTASYGVTPNPVLPQV